MSQPPEANSVDDDRNVAIYSRLLAQHGVDFRALNWGSRAGQQARFAVLAGVGDLSGKRVLDVGCGLADFYDWLREKGVAVDYTGIDLTPAMVERAKARFPTLRIETTPLAELAQQEPGAFDYVIASGIFTYRQTAPDDFLFETASQLYRLARKAAAFNSLSAWALDKDADEYYADPLQAVNDCRSLTPRLVLRHDYHPRDFTLYLYHEDGK